MASETEVTFLTDKDYLNLRQLASSALGRVGIGSNLGFTDHNILSGLSDRLGQPEPNRYDEWSLLSADLFKDSLANVLGLELPTTVDEVTSALQSMNSAHL